MTLNKFLTLDEAEKAIMMWEGVYIGYRKEGEFRVALYSLEKFFVEVFYNIQENKIQENKITRLNPFKGPNLLDPYLLEISLSEIECLL
ncbi:MAG: hypothetical protein H7Y07_12075 [Pyrinomonadaceae bacterium]|nr:hypothetical protein [Sphingobacteriaceae bacterium]